MITQAEQALSALRARGEKATPQRLRVIAALLGSSGHVSAHTIVRSVRQDQPDIEPSTIYRTLDWLRGLGVISQTDFGADAGTLYEWVGDPHHHLVCKLCGHMEAVSDGTLDGARDSLLRSNNFSLQPAHMVLMGVCRACRATGSAAAGHDVDYPSGDG
jgi:Fur family transcriptional regulator, ferric uptake regulator